MPDPKTSLAETAKTDFQLTGNVHFIEDFFKFWQDTALQETVFDLVFQRAQLFNTLLGHWVHDAAEMKKLANDATYKPDYTLFITDDQLQALQHQHGDQTICWPEGAYWPNRVLLHALNISIQQWSPLFAQELKDVIRAIRDMLAPDATETDTVKMARKSYSEQLLQQIGHQIACYEARQNHTEAPADLTEDDLEVPSLNTTRIDSRRIFTYLLQQTHPQLEAYALLCEHGFDPNVNVVVDDRDFTPLLLVACQGRDDLITILFKKTDPVSMLECRQYDGMLFLNYLERGWIEAAINNIREYPIYNVEQLIASFTLSTAFISVERRTELLQNISLKSSIQNYGRLINLFTLSNAEQRTYILEVLGKEHLGRLIQRFPQFFELFALSNVEQRTYILEVLGKEHLGRLIQRFPQFFELFALSNVEQRTYILKALGSTYLGALLGESSKFTCLFEDFKTELNAEQCVLIWAALMPHLGAFIENSNQLTRLFKLSETELNVAQRRLILTTLKQHILEPSLGLEVDRRLRLLTLSEAKPRSLSSPAASSSVVAGSANLFSANAAPSDNTQEDAPKFTIS